ncbi:MULTISPECIES: GGDEF domain-containing response regulator [Pseudoalteromonas]|jgi:diguanylate cyclase (GGDEF)-like protein|uniref:diguanylate cyclase n=2 Tax=Pseudoalteromonas TaxID=53246 RepID=A0AAD0XC33_9GAMM|nr:MULTISPECIES: response regulator [Pseudoalteromonas]MDC9520195.1 diguanylate cyclase [Pseudoalteromonas sp. Angola-31]MDY6886137.1 diguanylate cyclase [Pseudomonadota bacterium]HAG39754.1 GGDEF domain-containing protein [Pseudoalteromonas sp.]AYM85933.1 response regulator [Pseudoalteromonas agarivorans]KPV91114.1 Response regulator PleD [Pseudoalteromonas sp. P1-30]|tara:strand:+ start:4389 stop:5609 length:1221 start_codon:yes stop_codon:yes gene_type:complete
MQRVLVVEDSKVVQQVLRHLTAQYLDVAVDFAWSLNECQDYIEKHKYSLALVDLTLPDAPNGEVAKFTLSHAIPTVVLTSKIDEYKRQQMLELGVIDYVIKDNRDSYHYAIKLVAQLLRNQGCKALVADDSVLSRSLMKQMLEKQLFDVTDAQDGQQALEIIKSNPNIKLLMTDYAMPLMDGFELVKAVRNFRGRDDLAIIGLSGAGKHGLSARFIKYGANDFLTKPFMNEEFHCRVMQTMEQLSLIADIKESAYRDYLTGMYNRRYFYQYAEQLLKKQQQNTLALLDIDFFKNINDTLGHEAGDQALKQVATLIKTTFSKFTVARVGGEEFAIILDDIDTARGREYLEGFRKKLAKHEFLIDEKPFSITISIGVADFQNTDLTQAMRIADAALYEAKNNGRNCVV